MGDAKGERDDRREQYRALRQLENWLEMPMFLLSLAWVGLLAAELVWGASQSLESAVTAIWVVFLGEFVLKFVIAPDKLKFLGKSWLTIFALALPALRVFRLGRVIYVLRASRAIRGLTLARVLTAFNRGLGSTKKTLGQFGFGYVVMLTLLVTALGAAGMFAFERPQAGGGLRNFGDALWFTAMLMTTSGSDYWPKTPEGRLLCFLLALYAFAIFGYVTATLATLLVGQRAKDEQTLDNQAIESLRAEIKLLNQRLNESGFRP